MVLLPVRGEIKKRGKLSPPLMCCVGEGYEKPFPREQSLLLYNNFICLFLKMSFCASLAKTGKAVEESESVLSWEEVAVKRIYRRTISW